MKRKFSSMGRTAIALVLALSLSLVMAVPVSAAEGTIELDADWYKTTDTVKVTIEDADKDVLQEANLDKSTTTLDGMETVFQFGHTDIEFAVVFKPYDMRGLGYLVEGVHDALGQIVLQSAPPAEAVLMPAATPGGAMSLQSQPTVATALTVVLTVGTVGDETCTITGLDKDGNTLTEDITVLTGALTATGLEVFASVDSVDASAFGETDQTVSITCANFIFADYTYYGVETFQGKVISSVCADGVTPLMTETGPHTGIFKGTLKLAAATDDAVTPPELKVADAGTITAVYDDAAPVATVTYSATVDDTPPSLTNQFPADGDKINDTTPVVSVDVLDFASGVLGTPALGMQIIDVDNKPGDVSPVQTPITDGYHLEYHVGTGEALSEGLITVTITGADKVGNPIDLNTWTFDIDLTAPTMNSAATVTTKTIAVTFSEELDDTTVARGDFLVDGTITPSKVAVVTDVVTLTVPEMPTDDTPTVKLVGAVSDIAGNELTEPDDVTASDKVGPTVAIAVSPDPAGAADATFDLTFSEIMKTNVAPTVKFTDTVSDTPPGENEVTGGWTSTTTWQGTFDIEDLDAQEFESEVTVTGGEDLATNAMETGEGSFDIDTLVAATFWPADLATIYTASPVVRISFGEVVIITTATFDGEDVKDDLTTTNYMTYRLATEDLAEEYSYIIKVSAEDELGNTITDTSATFTVEVSQVITLYEGWNLISLPLILDDSDITEVISADTLDDVSNVTSVYYWYNDGTSTGWQSYVPGSGGTLTTMEDGKAYFIYMTGADILTITGRVMPEGPVAPPTYDVYAGWNFIGFKSTADMDNTLYLANLTTGGTPTGYSVLWGYEPDEGYFNVHPMNEHPGEAAPGEPGDIGDMEVGHGYWLWATEDGIIVPTG